MSATFRLISWTPYKKWYDLVLAGAVLAYLGAFYAAGRLAWRGAHAISDEVLVLRALGSCGFLMLSFVLCIGPLARLNPRFLPLLYNRRHLGVATFLVGLAHATLAVGYYHGFGRLNPLVSQLTSNVQYRSIAAFPFEILGLIALLILFAMAATSHDVWLRRIGPRLWKRLHMCVYGAWGLLVLHVALGALRAERNQVYAIGLVALVAIVSGLHIVAGRREVTRPAAPETEQGWIDACAVDDLAEGRGRVIVLPNRRERVALFRHAGRVSAIANACAHQGGPLGEGRIINGCVTCPWHGFQYRPRDGCAPPPFTEKLPTYRVKIVGGRIWVNAHALPPGTPVEPATIDPEPAEVAHA